MTVGPFEAQRGGRTRDDALQIGDLLGVQIVIDRGELFLGALDRGLDIRFVDFRLAKHAVRQDNHFGLRDLGKSRTDGKALFLVMILIAELARLKRSAAAGGGAGPTASRPAPPPTAGKPRSAVDDELAALKHKLAQKKKP